MSTSKEVNSPELNAPNGVRQPLSFKTMLFYGVGQTGGQIFRDSPATLLPVFMSTMLGIAPWLAGLVVLIPKLWVIICDPLMGLWSDNLKPSKSRRPFLAVGGLGTGALFIALFMFSGFSSQWTAALTVGLIFFVASTAFSAFSVPYLAVASELSDDPHERTKVLSFRIVFTILGVILGIGLAQTLVFKLGGDAAAWQKMAILFGAVITLSMLITAYGVPKDFGVGGAVTKAKSLKEQFSIAFSNKPFFILTSAYLVQSIAQACSFTVVLFVFIFAVGDIGLLLPFILVMSVGSICSQPFWLKLSRSIGKISAFWIACVGWLLLTITWVWVGNGQDVFMTAPILGELSTDHSLVLLRGFIIGVTNSGFSLLSFSLLTDTINLQKEKDGVVDEGLFSGVFSAIEKLGFALGPMLAGLIMSITGFQESIGGAVGQSEESIFGMVLCYSLVPAAGMFISLLIFTQYPKAFRGLSSSSQKSEA